MTESLHGSSRYVGVLADTITVAWVVRRQYTGRTTCRTELHTGENNGQTLKGGEIAATPPPSPRFSMLFLLPDFGCEKRYCLDYRGAVQPLSIFCAVLPNLRYRKRLRAQLVQRGAPHVCGEHGASRLISGCFRT